MAPRKRSSSKPKTRKKQRRTRRTKTKSHVWLKRLMGLAVIVLVGYIVYLDITVRWKFEGSRWVIPSHVYSRPLELYEGLSISKRQLIRELEMLGYRKQGNAQSPGSYAERGNEIAIHIRPFVFWDGPADAMLVSIRLGTHSIERLHGPGGAALDLARLEPHLYGSISTAHHEDRDLVRLQEVPSHLVEALLAIEDRNYFTHLGVDPRGLARALWVNLVSGGVVQGGSTLTQQLVKNFYLSHEKTIQRKLTEMMMAVLLEIHYDKDEILEAYLNEVFLGQSGNRAIHGFGLASFFYFDRPLAELRLHEVALLAALVKGASYYNPVRSPERARLRRNLVLNQMAELGYIKPQAAAAAKKKPLGVAKHGSLAASDFPAYLDFVRIQLRRDYEEEDLRTEGLNIFTALDPLIQRELETAVRKNLDALEQSRDVPAGALEAAALVVRTDNGEVVALVGGRQQRYSGFNRALEAERPIGSLIKPAVFLAAIERGYSLASLLNDEPIVVEQPGAAPWEPKNYDNKFHGSVRLVDALTYSYNIATVWLGHELGPDKVVKLLRRLGLNRDIHPYPSMLLGAVSMTPVEMAQMYLGFASGGFRIPLRTTRSVLTGNMSPLARYPLSLKQVIDGRSIVVLDYALRAVVSRGTASALSQSFPSSLKLAGKTGTTDGYRDSWFAGYSGNYMAVVWVGRDDNSSTTLTGSSGAMRIWEDVMSELHLQPVNFPVPNGIEYHGIDSSGRLADGCNGVSIMPFVSGTVPKQRAPCSGTSAESTRSDTTATGSGKDPADEK